MATTSQWSFDLISITTQNWTGLWILSSSLVLLNQIYWFYPANLADLQKRKKTNIIWEVVARYSAKTSSWKFHKIYREIPVLESSFWRSSLSEVFCKKEVLENFAKFKGKHLCQSLFFNKVADLRPAHLLKKKLLHRCFLWILQNFSEHLLLQNASGGCVCF